MYRVVNFKNKRVVGGYSFVEKDKFEKHLSEVNENIIKANDQTAYVFDDISKETIEDYQEAMAFAEKMIGNIKSKLNEKKF